MPLRNSARPIGQANLTPVKIVPTSRRGEPVIVIDVLGAEHTGTIEHGPTPRGRLTVLCEAHGHFTQRMQVKANPLPHEAKVRKDPGGSRPLWVGIVAGHEKMMAERRARLEAERRAAEKGPRP